MDEVNDVVVIFIEGYTEVEFYKEVVQTLRCWSGGKLRCRVETKNMRGIGNYKNGALAYFEKEIKKKHPDCKYHLLLCYDTDVFEFAKKPPVAWGQVRKELLRAGASDVKRIATKGAIVDWFLKDAEGVLRYLGLPPSTKIPPGPGKRR